MHRWVWDLRYETPIAGRYQYPISAVPHRTPRTPEGPLALPGSYKVRLTVNGKTLTSALTIKIDPRVPASRADLEGLFQAERKLAAALTESSQASLEAHSFREQVQKLNTAAQPDLKPAVESLEKELATLLSGSRSATGVETEPGLDDLAGEAGGLYGEIGGADAAPTTAQWKAINHTGEEAEEALRKWNRSSAATRKTAAS